MTTLLNTTSINELKDIISRIEILSDDKKAIQEDIKSIYKSAKDSGFETKIIRKVIKLRSISKAAREEESTLISVYGLALGEEL